MRSAPLDHASVAHAETRRTLPVSTHSIARIQSQRQIVEGGRQQLERRLVTAFGDPGLVGLSEVTLVENPDGVPEALVVVRVERDQARFEGYFLTRPTITAMRAGLCQEAPGCSATQKANWMVGELRAHTCAK